MPFNGLERIVAAPYRSGILGYSAGPGAYVEIAGKGDQFRIFYNSPWRPAIRRPREEIELDSDTVARLGRQASQLKRALETHKKVYDENGGQLRKEREASAQMPGTSGDRQAMPRQMIEESRSRTDKALWSIARDLYQHILPEEMRQEIENRSDPISLEIGAEEDLSHLPFELMHDGNGYLCLKHNVGRYAIRRRGEYPERPDFGNAERPRILLISVPEPPGYPRLERVAAEASLIRELAGKIVGEENLVCYEGPAATFDNVSNELKKSGQRFHIVHFCGHAKFDEGQPERSGIVLHRARDEGKDGGLMRTGTIRTWFRAVRPVFCFVNGCESAAPSGRKGGKFGVYGLGRAFLDTGAYFLGSRSMVGDGTAEAFARAFYVRLLRENRPLGEAVRLARVECRRADALSFDWASYVFYGDPRVYFPKDLPTDVEARGGGVEW